MTIHFKNIALTPIFFILFCLTFTANAEPTSNREWKTKSGHKTTATALKVENGKVHFKKPNGSVIKVKLDLLSEGDQEFLTKHFELKPAEKPDTAANTVSGSGAEPLTGLSQPQGKTVGPIDTGNGSTYYLYLPKSLKQNRPAPLLFYTHSGGGGKGQLINSLRDAAETLGWVMAISVESSNQNPKREVHAINCMKHILKTWPVDKDRIHYSGNSGGAALAFQTSTKIRAYGVMPNVGYIPGTNQVKAKVVYGLGGGNDYNRYLTSFAAKKFKKDGFHRMNPGGHGASPASYYEDGMLWMHCKFMKKGKSKHRDEAADFEASIINWTNRIKKKNPMRAYSNACVVRDIYEMSSANARILNDIIKELAADQNNVLYHEGLLEIHKLSMKYFAPLGENGGSKKKHDHPKSRKAAEKLKEKYSGVKAILDVLNAMMKQTV